MDKMKILKIKDSMNILTNYVVVDKISRFFTERHKNGKYSLHIDVMGFFTPIAENIDNPDKIIQKLINAIEITDDEMLTFSVIRSTIPREEDSNG